MERYGEERLKSVVEGLGRAFGGRVLVKRKIKRESGEDHFGWSKEGKGGCFHLPSTQNHHPL